MESKDPKKNLNKIDELVERGKAKGVLTYKEVMDTLEELELEEAAEIIENMDSDDAVDVLEEMDEEIGEKLVSMPPRRGSMITTARPFSCASCRPCRPA